MAILAPAEGHLLTEILDASYALWNEGLSRPAYEQFYRAQLKTPFGARHLQRWALVNSAGSAVASGKIYGLDAELDGRTLRVAGLGAIFTQPPARGRGAARELVDGMLDKARADGADIALLFSEIGTDYYARLGFTPLSLMERRIRVTESTRRGAPMTMVRSGEDRDLADIVALGGTRAAGYRFHLRRDRDLVHYAITKKRLFAGLGPPGARELQFFVAEEGGLAAAYVLITVKPAGWTLEEYGDRDPSGARVGAILQVLIARDPAERRAEIAGWIPRAFVPPQVAVVAEQESKDVMMVRPLSDRGKDAVALGGDHILFWKSDHF